MIDPATSLEQWCDVTARREMLSVPFLEGKDVPLLRTTNIYRRIIERYRQAADLADNAELHIRDREIQAAKAATLEGVIELLLFNIPRREK